MLLPEVQPAPVLVRPDFKTVKKASANKGVAGSSFFRRIARARMSGVISLQFELNISRPWGPRATRRSPRKKQVSTL